jgi:hypothetical protein
MEGPLYGRGKKFKTLLQEECGGWEALRHHQHVRPCHPEKSTMAEHIMNLRHHIQFHDTSILAKKSGLLEHITGEAIEIGLHPDTMNREEDLSPVRFGSFSFKPRRNEGRPSLRN